MRLGQITNTIIQQRSATGLPPGVGFARFARVKALARLDHRNPADVSKELYGGDSLITVTIKAAVAAGSTSSGWAADLVSAEGGIVADFLAYLRPATILGKFGVGGVPSLRMMPFRVPVVTQTGGGAGYWVGEGKPKPLTAFDFDRSTLEPLKVANICVLTEESIRDSSPASEQIVRDALRDALAARLDIDFIDPGKAASAGISPASVTHGAPSIVSTGIDADAVRMDIRALFATFIAANNTPAGGVWIMSSMTALSLSMMTNALGQAEFPGINMTGGTFQGLPVIVSDHVGNIVVLVKTSEIFLGDDGGVSVDLSRDATLEMSDAPTQDALAGTGTSLVSMFQVGAVALRAERTVNWRRARSSSVAFLTNVGWGGTPPTS